MTSGNRADDKALLVIEQAHLTAVQKFAAHILVFVQEFLNSAEVNTNNKPLAQWTDDDIIEFAKASCPLRDVQ
jgi:hypothetical protein